jgi:hypothetical protein
MNATQWTSSWFILLPVYNLTRPESSFVIQDRKEVDSTREVAIKKDTPYYLFRGHELYFLTDLRVYECD